MSTSAKRRRKRKKQRVRKALRIRRNKADQAAMEMRWEDAEEIPWSDLPVVGRISSDKPNLQNIPAQGYSGSFKAKLDPGTMKAFIKAHQSIQQASVNMAAAMKKFEESE